MIWDVTDMYYGNYSEPSLLHNEEYWLAYSFTNIQKSERNRKIMDAMLLHVKKSKYDFDI